MTGPTDVEAYQAAREIMKYFEANADAADTIEGIALWWLSRPSRWSTATIERAMNYLVVEGSVERQTIPDGTVVYRKRRTTDGEV